MRKFFAFSFVFFLLGFLGGTVAKLAHGEMAANRTVKKQKVSQTLTKAPEPCSTEGCARLREGRGLLEKGKYAEAIEALLKARDAVPVVDDYVLFFLSTAYAKKKDYDASDALINTLLTTYPGSPLKKKAAAMRIRNAAAKAESASSAEARRTFINELERYVADYQDDREMKFLFGKALKKEGEKERAKKVLRQVYATSSAFSDSAYKELDPSDITAEDMLAKASACIQEMEYRKAEAVLRKALTGAVDPLREDILKKLGLALFRQKRYREAAIEYSKAGDLYSAARSLYRAGDMEAFSAAVAKLVSMEDRRAGSLLIALASKKRREGKTEEALKLYGDVRKTYPSYAEEALWGAAWTCFRARDFEKASEALTELNSSHPHNRYRYWKAQCTRIADQGGAALPTVPPPSLMKGERQDFYAILSEMHEGESALGEFCTAGSEGGRETGGAAHKPAVYASDAERVALSRLIERFFVLAAVGMKDAAVAELVDKSGEFSGPDVLLYLGQVLKDAGAYKSAIALVSRLPKNQETPGKADTRIDDILFPRAYWSIVVDAAKDNRVDPLVLLAVMREESRFEPAVRSVAGAVGLMQLMPQTAQRIGYHAVIATEDISEVKTNIALGAYYLGILVKEFKSLPAAIAAYNAGEEKVREWLAQGNYRSFDEFIEDIPYDETRNYVKKVLVTYYAYKRQAVEDASACAPRVTQW